MLKPQDRTAVITIIASFIRKNQVFTWHDLMSSVQDAKVPVKNWLDVRNVLQHFLDRKKLFRTYEICEERYTTDPRWGNVNGVVFFPDDDGTGTGSFIWIQHIEQIRAGDFMVTAFNLVGREWPGLNRYSFFIKGKAEFEAKAADLFYREVHKVQRANDRAQSSGWNL